MLNRIEFDFGRDNLPKSTYPDIVNYLLFAPSPIAGEELKCYKSMEAYNFFVLGYVKEVGVKIYNDLCLVFGRVGHSQKLSLPSAKPWLIVEKQGRVLSSHCDCTTGVGEACSHVGAVMFYVDAINKWKDSVTVTGEKAYWV